MGRESFQKFAPESQTLNGTLRPGELRGFQTSVEKRPIVDKDALGEEIAIVVQAVGDFYKGLGVGRRDRKKRQLMAEQTIFNAAPQAQPVIVQQLREIYDLEKQRGRSF